MRLVTEGAVCVEPERFPGLTCYTPLFLLFMGNLALNKHMRPHFIAERRGLVLVLLKGPAHVLAHQVAAGGFRDRPLATVLEDVAVFERSVTSGKGLRSPISV